VCPAEDLHQKCTHDGRVTCKISIENHMRFTLFTGGTRCPDDDVIVTVIVDVSCRIDGVSQFISSINVFNAKTFDTVKRAMVNHFARVRHAQAAVRGGVSTEVRFAALPSSNVGSRSGGRAAGGVKSKSRF